MKTAYKVEEKYDLLIVDECHRSLSPEYRKLYTNIQYEQVLGLTGTLPENREYLEFMDTVMPVVYQKSINDALDLGAIADYTIYNLEVPMSRKNRARYRTFDGMLKHAQMEIGILKRYDDELKDLPIFEIAQKYATFKDKSQLTK